jgi:hypothetical protein
LVGLEGERREKGRGTPPTPWQLRSWSTWELQEKCMGEQRKNLPPGRFVKKIICPQAGFEKKKLAPGQTRQDFSCFSFLLRPFLHKVCTTEIGINWNKASRHPERCQRSVFFRVHSRNEHTTLFCEQFAPSDLQRVK